MSLNFKAIAKQYRVSVFESIPNIGIVNAARVTNMQTVFSLSKEYIYFYYCLKLTISANICYAENSNHRGATTHNILQ